VFRIIPEGLAFQEHVLLKNGQGLTLRPATDTDISIVKALMKRISPESLRMRFMASVSELPEKTIKELCSGDFTKSGSLIAILKENVEDKVVALGNYFAVGNGHSAEVAFLVEDKYQGKGIGTLLLERLAGLAAANGFIELEAEVLPDNQQMINLFKNSGLQKHRVWSSDTVHIELPADGAAALWERADLRERIAVGNSLIPLLEPKVAVVIGASRNPSSIGNIVFKNILAAEFKGTVYPVNPNANSINGIKAYHEVNQLPEEIDLAIIAVPAEMVQKVAEDAIKAGAKGIVVVSAGFADVGAEGRERQEKLVALVRTHGVRLLGPSCLGLMNTDPNVRLNASLAPKIMKPGNAGFFSHSAALGIVILEYAMEKGIEFTTFVSAGNRADISGNDLLSYWEEDPKTKLAILYLETFGNPRRFVRIARRMTYKKPILCVKSARSVAGKRAAEAKSGAYTGGVREVEALFMQTGIILAPSLEDLFDVAIVLANQPLPAGNRVSVIANSTGMATLFADACEMNNLEIEGDSIIDLGAFTSADNYERTVKEVLQKENVDTLLIGFACVGDCDSESVAKAIRKAVHDTKQSTGVEKTVLLCFMGAAGTISLFDEMENNNAHRKFPAFRFPEAAVNALGRIVRYVEFKKQPLGKLIWYDDVKADKARTLLQPLIMKKDSREIINIDKILANQILECFGIPITDIESRETDQVKIKVRPDQLFGPLIEVKISETRRITRITPLTDRDLKKILEDMPVQISKGISQILGRVSQMIEEIPWLWELELQIVTRGIPMLVTINKLSVKPGGATRPSY
jgi:acetate---CoA ligase (ADP-forming)